MTAPPIRRVIDSYEGQPCTWIRPVDAPTRPGEPCGIIHDRCRGHVARERTNRETGEREPNPRYGDPCGQPARVGAVKCKRHLIGKREVERQRSAAILQANQGAVGRILGVTEPHYRGMPAADVLAATLARAAGMAAALRIRIEALEWETEHETTMEPDGSRVAVKVTKAGIVGPNSVGDQRLHVLLPELREWEKLTGQLAKGIVDADLEERRQALTAAQGQALLAIVEATLADVGVEWSPEVRAAFGRQVDAHADVIDATARDFVLVDAEDLTWPDDDEYEGDDEGYDPPPVLTPGTATPSGATWLDDFGDDT